MAAPKENLLSLGHLTGTEQNTFTRQREHCAIKSLNKPVLLQADSSTLQHRQHLKKIHLQQRWQELKDREHAAQQHNRQLLLQFEKAQDTLKDMLVRNAAMKTIRVEYERYLVESSPRWQQQLEEKTQTAQKKCLQQRMEDCLRSYQKITEEERGTKSSADRPLLSQGSTTRPQKIAAPQAYSSQEYSNYNQDGFSHLPYTQSSPQTHSQSHTGRFPVRVPYRPHASSQVPPSSFPHPHPFPLHHLPPTPGYHHHPPWLRQDPPGWASPQPDYPWSWAAGAAGIPSGSEALWGQIYMEEPPPESRVSQTVGEDKTSRAPSSKAERGGGSRSRYLSQELDIKPVRLSSGQAESSESGRDSSLASGETRKRREKSRRTHHSSSDRERCSSQQSSRTSSAIVMASAAVAQSSESGAPSEKHCNSSSSRRTRRSGGLTVGSPRSEEVAKERTSSKGDDSESQHTGEELGSSSEESKSKNLGNQSHDDKSESCKEESGPKREEESGSDHVKTENGDADENEKEESSSSEESNSEKSNEEKKKKILGAGEDDGEENRRDEQQEDRDVEGDDEEVCARKNTTEEEETAAEEEMEDQGDDEEQSKSLKKKDGENRKEGSASSQDEDEDEDGSEGSENKLEEDKEGSDDEEDEDGSEGSENKIEEDKEGSDDEEDEDGSEGSENKIEEDKEGSDDEEDEDGSEGSENNVGEDEEGSNKEEDGESEEEEEHRSDEAGKPKDRDSDDSIISPQQKRSTQVQVIPKEAAEDDEGDEEEEEEDEEEEENKPRSCNDDSDEISDEDIEDLLAPQEQTKEEKDLKAEEKPKAFPDSMKIFQVEQNTSKTNLPNNSDEFDDFYD